MREERLGLHSLLYKMFNRVFTYLFYLAATFAVIFIKDRHDADPWFLELLWLNYVTGEFFFLLLDRLNEQWL